MSEKPAGKPKSTGKKGGSSSKSKKEGGSSYLVRQSKAKKVVTEEELRKKDVITPEDVLALTEATKGIGACVHSTRFIVLSLVLNVTLLVCVYVGLCMCYGYGITA